MRHPLRLVLALTVLAGCHTDDPAEVSAPPSAPSANASPNAGTEAPTADPAETHHLSVAISCVVPDPSVLTVLDVTLDGAPLQQIELTCNDTEGAMPNGRFEAEIPAGEHMIRVEDLTHQVSARERLFVTGDMQATISHRVMANDAGHMTAISAEFLD